MRNWDGLPRSKLLNGTALTFGPPILGRAPGLEEGQVEAHGVDTLE